MGSADTPPAFPGPPGDAHLQEHTLSSSELLKGHFLHAFRDTVRLPDGREASREYVRHPGAVMIVAQLDDGRLVMERQYRYPVHAVMVEFPAGKLDAGEDSLACAKRELREETGYTARRWARAGVLHPVISYSTEFIDIWFATDLTAGERQLDAGEFLDVFTAHPAELLKWCSDGHVTDGKTLAGALWLQNVLSGAWLLNWQDNTDPDAA
jgi:ADP-ribose pyrophosphatase